MSKRGHDGDGDVQLTPSQRSRLTQAWRDSRSKITTTQHDGTQFSAQREWPLFGAGNCSMSDAAVQQQRMILDLITQRTQHRQRGQRLKDRLDEAYSTLQWWKSVGCEFCFLMRSQSGIKHTLESCDRWHSCDKAKSILIWLQTLEIRRFSDFDGACSMCTHSSYWCGDICRQHKVATVNSRTMQEFWKKELMSKSSPDGHCEQKPVMRRVIAALCAYDDQFLGKLLVRYASDTDNVDLSSEQAARDWFERKVPFVSEESRSWIPKVVFIFETLVVGFYIRQNSFLGLPPLDGLPHSSPWGTAREVLEKSVAGEKNCWRRIHELVRCSATIDWCLGRCTYCIGCGREGEDHEVQSCPNGGAELRKRGIGKAIYGRTQAPTTACDECYLPKILCDKWPENQHDQYRIQDFSSCRYREFVLRDAIIGLFESNDPRFKDAIFKAARQHWKEKEPLRVLDIEAIVDFLLNEITVAGFGATEMARQMMQLTHMMWYGCATNNSLVAEDEWANLVARELSLNDEGWGRWGLAPPARSCGSSASTLVPTCPTQQCVGLRERPCMRYDGMVDADVRVSQGELEDSLIHRYIHKPINEWLVKDIQKWDEDLGQQPPKPVVWRDWEKNGLLGVQAYQEERIRKQLYRWSVRCPLCLLHGDAACHDHFLSACTRAESANALDTRTRLQEAIAGLRVEGIEDYGPVPWCSTCCLPRSRCPSWTKQDGDGNTTSEWNREDDQLWDVQDESQCIFRDIIVNAVSAMVTFSLLGAKVFEEQVKMWRESSRIRVDKECGIEGWLVSRMVWDQREVMVMLRVFCRLDKAVEEMWVQEKVNGRKEVLGLPRSEFCLGKSGEQQQEIVDVDGDGWSSSDEEPYEWRGRLMRST